MHSTSLTRRQLLLAGSSLALPGTPSLSASPDFDLVMARCADEMLREQPQSATSLGVDVGARAGLRALLDDRSRAADAARHASAATRLSALLGIARDGLSAEARLTLDSVTFAHELAVDGRRFGVGATTLQAAMTQTASPYVISQMTGAFAEVPDFLNTEHPIADRHDVQAWLHRLDAYAGALDAETERFRVDRAAGVLPPRFVLDTLLGQMRDALALPAAKNELAEGLQRRCAEVGLDALPIAQAHRLLEQRVRPALARQHDTLLGARSHASDKAGVCHLRDGDRFYAWFLQVATAGDLTPEQVHRMGHAEVRRLEAEADAALRRAGLRDGSVGQRLHALGADPAHCFPNDAAGRAAALAHAQALMARARAAMPRLSRLDLRADVRIQRVPASIERGAASAYMAPGSMDGRRPALFSLNLHDTATWPRWTLPTLIHHETVPGHAWQEACAVERLSGPLVRALIRFNASSEGWALYAEQLADEAGLFEDDPLGRLGYLQAMLKRAGRLVVDTGLHAKGWTRQQAIDWLSRLIGAPAAGLAGEIDRYCVKPGQACGYMVGLQQLLQLRQQAQRRQGRAFDLRDFNDRVVLSGNVPFSLLAESG
jgi:uncharacterized protein (DUF885 family)